MFNMLEFHFENYFQEMFNNYLMNIFNGNEEKILQTYIEMDIIKENLG